MTQPAHPDGAPWQWPESTWRRIVGRARAGRSLAPRTWPKGARCAVAISFDADHDTIPLRDSDESPMRISQGQYGNRQAMPRIRRLLAHRGCLVARRGDRVDHAAMFHDAAATRRAARPTLDHEVLPPGRRSVRTLSS